ncbi:hypothetical protein [Pseudomonas sp. R37(2017)]|uniref:hypothetical protein n=1 Tax=Pseudomonas sp. R37(2017) TaxID=1981685 RepID=UPI000A1E7C87|nr:hypothetical protein [Pseudomonas sp. R37(2017)]
MSAPTIKTSGQGTISAIRDVRIENLSTKFAMVMPDGGFSTVAIRIGPNVTAEGHACFLVGDAVKYTMSKGATGEPQQAHGLEKSGLESWRA